jgi:hypothetical protein
MLNAIQVLCTPDTQFPLSEHKHHCSCGTTWAHSDEFMQSRTRDEFVKGHTCPTCHTKVTKKFFTKADRERIEEYFCRMVDNIFRF